MGSQNSIQADHPLQNSDVTWINEASTGVAHFVRSSDGKLGELHNIQAIDLQRDMIIYKMRYDNPSSIVTTYKVSKQSEKLLCGFNERINVITERIPYRLTDLGSIGYGEGLFIMDNILKAAVTIRDLYLKKVITGNYINNIVYKQNMICLTDEGKPKLWVNEDIAQNNYQLDGDKPKQQIAVIENLMNMVESKMSGNKFIKYMKEKLNNEKSGKLNILEEAIEFVSICREHQNKTSGITINSIVLPHMVMNLNNGQVSAGEEEGYVYGSNIRRKIEEAQKTHDFSKLSKPPIPRKTSKSKSRDSSRSKPNSNKSLTPTKKPNITPRHSKSPNKIQNPIVHIHPHSLSNSLVTQTQQHLYPKPAILEKPLSANVETQKQSINPFRQIEEGAKNIKEIKPIELICTTSNHDKQATNNKTEVPITQVNQRINTMGNYRPYSLNSPSHQQKPVIKINGHQIERMKQQQIKKGTEQLRPYPTNIPIAHNNTKVNFTFGQPQVDKL